MSEETLMDIYVAGLLVFPRIVFLYQWLIGELPDLGVPNGVAILMFLIAPHALAGATVHKNAPREEVSILLLYLLGAIEFVGFLFGTHHAF